MECVAVINQISLSIRCLFISGLMPTKHAQEICTRNLCKSSCTRNFHVCRSIWYKFFSDIQVSCTQL